MEYLPVQLKVCEGCGNLWFRTQSDEAIYGRCCAGKLAQHAKARPEQRRGWRATRHQRAVSQAVMIGGAE